MRYIGNKQKLLNEIEQTIKTVAPNATSVVDLFSGSGSVSNFLKESGYEVICNDQLYFSYVLLRGITTQRSIPEFSFDPIATLNDLTLEQSGFSIEECFIYQNYAPHEGCERMYFTRENAIKIDIIRLTIEKWKNEKIIDENGYFYLLAALIEAVPFVSNITGVYAAYLKKWDKRALKTLHLQPPVITYQPQKSQLSMNGTIYYWKKFKQMYFMLTVHTIAGIIEQIIIYLKPLRDTTIQKFMELQAFGHTKRRNLFFVQSEKSMKLSRT